MQQVVDQALAEFDETERATMLRLLRRVVKNLDESAEV